jgi:hypothetical protein
MKQFFDWGVNLARSLIAVVFLLNATGIIDQSVPAKEIIERGIPAAIVLAMMIAGRSIEPVGGDVWLPPAVRGARTSHALHRVHGT